jgi:AraC-like DNA-binding protein
MLSALRAMNADVDAIVSSVGLSLEKLQQPDTRIPIETGVALAFAAAQATGDEALGLHLAERYTPGVFGVLDYLGHSSSTLGGAIQHLCRYNRLLQDAVETSLEIKDNRAIVSQRAFGGLVIPAGIVENAIANLIVIGRELTGTPLIPIEVHFRHSEPSYSSEYTRLFRTKVRFEAELDGVILPVEALDLPLPNADPQLCSILDSHARLLLKELPRVARVSQRVRELIAAALKEGAPTADAIAQKLEMSERTLRRRLHEDGTTYEDLLDGLRRALSERYLEEPKLSTEEVALMLGYSELSTFGRAFRRWHGITPAQYRRRQAIHRESR